VAEYLAALSRAIHDLQTTPGRLTQTAEMASFDAWIKVYRPDENTVNTAISYYTKGAVLGFLLDARIRAATDDAKGLDDVMRLAFARYSGPKGFTPQDFRKTASEVAGVDLGPWFTRGLETTEELDYQSALDWFGLRFRPSRPPDEIADRPAWLGGKMKVDGGRLLFENVPRGTPAYDAGVNAGDELLGIDDVRIAPTVDELDKRLAAYRSEQKVTLLVAHLEQMTRLPATLGAPPPDAWTLEQRPDITASQRAHLRTWLGQ
jgi:predicted metalloprotease with PDZ domain